MVYHSENNRLTIPEWQSCNCLEIFTSESLLKCTIWVFSIVSHVLVHSPGWGNVFCGSSLLNTEHRLYVEWLSSWCALALSWDRKSPLYSLRLCVFRPWWAEASGWLVCACEKVLPLRFHLRSNTHAEGKLKLVISKLPLHQESETVIKFTKVAW